MPYYSSYFNYCDSTQEGLRKKKLGFQAGIRMKEKKNKIWEELMTPAFL
jgi:hypothetical protein